MFDSVIDCPRKACLYAVGKNDTRGNLSKFSHRQKQIHAAWNAAEQLRFCENLRDPLVAYFRELNGADLIRLTIGATVRRPFSQISFLTAWTTKGTVELVAKSIVHHPENRELTRRDNQALIEYFTLQRLHPRFSAVPGCSVPRPVAVIPEFECYVMERVEGRPLTEHLDRARFYVPIFRLKGIENLYYLSGLWLRHLQEFTSEGVRGPEILECALKGIEARLTVLDALPLRGQWSDLSTQVRDFISDQTWRLGQSGIPSAGRHGDFGPWNIIVNRAGITVLDFFGFESGPICHDVIKMLVNLGDEEHYVGYVASRIEAIRKAFLEGYGRHAVIPAPAALISEAFHRVCSITAALTAKGGNILRRLERNRSLGNHVSWFRNPMRQTPLWRSLGWSSHTAPTEPMAGV